MFPGQQKSYYSCVSVETSFVFKTYFAKKRAVFAF
jgi:hypothetical protein